MEKVVHSGGVDRNGGARLGLRLGDSLRIGADVGCGWYRYKTRQATTKRTSAPSPRATTRSLRTWTANTFTVLATSTGRRTARRSRSTCTASSTCRRRRRRRIHWRWKVSRVWLMAVLVTLCVADCDGVVCSAATVGAAVAGQGRAVVYRDAGDHASEYGGEHEWEGQVVEHLSAGRADWGGRLSGLVAEAVL